MKVCRSFPGNAFRSVTARDCRDRRHRGHRRHDRELAELASIFTWLFWFYYRGLATIVMNSFRWFSKIPSSSERVKALPLGSRRKTGHNWAQNFRRRKVLQIVLVKRNMQIGDIFNILLSLSLMTFFALCWKVNGCPLLAQNCAQFRQLDALHNPPIQATCKNLGFYLSKIELVYCKIISLELTCSLLNAWNSSYH